MLTRGFTEVAYKVTSDLLTLPFFDIDIILICLQQHLRLWVLKVFISVFTNTVLKNSIWSWSHLGLVQKGLAHLHNTDSGAASILHTHLSPNASI